MELIIIQETFIQEAFVLWVFSRDPVGLEQEVSECNDGYETKKLCFLK